MGRKITKEAVKAFFGGTRYSNDNTTVMVDGDVVKLVLHGSVIARRRGTVVEISDGGYRSKTTKERLAGICSEVGASIFQKAGAWYLQSRETDLRPIIMPHKDFVLVDGSAVEKLVLGIEREGL